MIGAYLTETVTLKQYKGQDKYQEPNAMTSVPVKARVDYKERQINNIEGNLVVSSAKVYVQNRTIVVSGFSTRVANTISYHDLITIDGTDRRIIQIAREQDFRTRFLIVYVS